MEGAYLAPFLRLKADDVTFAEGLVRFLPLFKPLLPLLLCTCLIAAERRTVCDWPRPQYRATLFVFGWMLSSIPAVIAMRAMYGHYYLPLVPSMALLTALYVARVLSPRYGNVRAVAAIAISAMLCYPILYFQGGRDSRLLAGADLPRAVVAKLADEGMQPGARLHVTGFEMVTYLLSDAKPLTPYPYSLHTECDFSAFGIDGTGEIERVFAGIPEYVVRGEVDGHVGVCPRTDIADKLNSHLATDYTLATEIESRNKTVRIYRLNGTVDSKKFN